MSPARPGPRRTVGTVELLEAVATRGRFWTAVFAHDEIRVVNEALDRELFAGTLRDACSLTPLGKQTLASLSGGAHNRGTVDHRVRYGCELHDPCWTVQCIRCAGPQIDHVSEGHLDETVQALLAEHACPGPAPRDAPLRIAG